MIQKNRVYRKSAKGTEAIATRQHGLGPKLRSMLILIDGKRGFGELARLSAALGDPEQLLQQLLEGAFIEEAPVVPDPAEASKSTSATPAASGAGLSLLQAQRFAVRKLTELVGPSAESLCLRIEAARNVEDYQAAVARAERMVREFRGAHAAVDFAAQIDACKPG